MTDRMMAELPLALDLAVIGGGASGFFTALQYAELAPRKRVAIFEKGSQFLQKVRISGGGRCNVTHSCFDPRELAKHYPRGSKELHAAFHRATFRYGRVVREVRRDAQDRARRADVPRD